MVDDWTAYYAATDELHNASECPLSADQLVEARGIEIGHIFYFGKKYSAPMGAKVQGPDGKEIDLEMGSYGIGVSRLVGAIIEAGHDDHGIVWPPEVAPFRIGLINLKAGDSGCDAACEEIYSATEARGIEILYDDRDERAGAKFADMDLIGLPWQLAIGPRGVEKGIVEVKDRKTGEKTEIEIGAIDDFLKSIDD
jgi:prolyl-tRNA synthetase